ncbi:hypothetical protein ANCCEY_04264 [Ancylostoma ceylanicum]|uniref:ShKT domain-containing protein n=1 Tax=Ancylostoma ceylanicum TaxID=53326 RepID=A0A0D6LXR4_9BILA|nr:hypothetical protein ANCCEY_04264 [Ancylostoma ceylanicum]
MNCLLASGLLLVSMIALVDCDCYENWSRCTPKTYFWTGILWKSCEDYCEKCKGKATGNCEPVENKECSGGYQCQCSGKDVDKSDNWLVIATCKLGL